MGNFSPLGDIAVFGENYGLCTDPVLPSVQSLTFLNSLPDIIKS